MRLGSVRRGQHDAVAPLHFCQDGHDRFVEILARLRVTDLACKGRRVLAASEQIKRCKISVWPAREPDNQDVQHSLHFTSLNSSPARERLSFIRSGQRWDSLEMLPRKTERFGESFLNTQAESPGRTLESRSNGARIWMDAHENSVAEWLNAWA